MVGVSAGATNQKLTKQPEPLTLFVLFEHWAVSGSSPFLVYFRRSLEAKSFVHILVPLLLHWPMENMSHL